MNSNNDIYFCLFLLEGTAEKNMDFPAPVKRPSASFLSAFHRQGNNAMGDNNVLFVIQSTFTHIII